MAVAVERHHRGRRAGPHRRRPVLSEAVPPAAPAAERSPRAPLARLPAWGAAGTAPVRRAAGIGSTKGRLRGGGASRIRPRGRHVVHAPPAPGPGGIAAHRAALVAPVLVWPAGNVYAYRAGPGRAARVSAGPPT